ncbi:10049_t:CDS:1 [Funneliformis geosporum]|uniref:5227_t:CDS:1 n=1 Tax=Funneliformis geosporum TaxID=1117311 RepID=A0A9W4SRZ5_9GLOM|nr:5227_t:CDS:1 [Funneliformis geosporum]CAI2181193.1 10049_t:CDS:1 [Funneliformis geosporum]
MSLINRFLPELNRAFTLFDEPFFTNVARRYPSSLPTLSDRFTFPNLYRPNVDVSETDKNYVVEAEVPGMKKEDLSVEFLDDNTLVLKGKIERGAPAEEMRTVDATGVAEGSTTEPNTTGEVVEAGGAVIDEPKLWTSERMRGHFQRSFQFPSKIDHENSKASYKDGILSIFVPKIERHGKQISIE